MQTALHRSGCQALRTRSAGPGPRPVVARPQPCARRLCVQAKAKAKPQPKGFGPAKQAAKGIAGDAPCPCGSTSNYEACCGPYHAGAVAVPGPEAMLRSRYSAYAAKDPAFIADTTHPESPEYSGSRASYMGKVKQTMRQLDPLGLTILAQEPGATPDEAFITFRLKRRIRDPEVPRNAPEVDEITEKSKFIRVGGRWYYSDSEFLDGKEAGGAEEAKKEEGKKKGLLGLF